MADNVKLPATGSGDATPNVAADEATYSGDTAKVQLVRLVSVAGAEGSKTISEIVDAPNGVDVDVTRLPALPAGSNNIGDVDVLTLPALPAGTANIGDVDVLTVPPPLSTTGGGAEATALRVTVASDSTGVLSVDDNGGSLTVDAPVGTPAFVRLSDGAAAITTLAVSLASVPSHAVTNAGTFAVQADSVIPGTGATNLGKAEDAAHTSGDVGVMALGVRKDSGATIAGTDGDYSPLQVDANGNLRVNIAAGGTSATDEAAYTPASSAGTPIMGAADETSPDAAAEGTLAIIRSTLSRALHVNLRDAAGAEVAVGGGTQYTEDAAAAANPVGTALNLVRDDARGGSLTTTDGDNVAARGTNAGELYVKHVDAIPVSSLPASTNTLEVVGDAAHDAAAAGNPVLQAGYASAAAPADVSADGDAVRAWHLRNGAQAVAITVAGALVGGDAPNGLDVDVTRVSGNVTVINAGTFAAQAAQSGTWTVQPGNTQNTTPWAVSGLLAHDAANTSANNPAVRGSEAIAHGANPTAVAAGDVTKAYSNRAGIPFVIGGHPNTRVAVYNTTAAQTDDGVLAAIAAGTKYVVTRLTVTLDEAATVGVAVRLGFGATTLPALGASAADGVEGLIVSHPGLVPGAGLSLGDGSGIIGVGGDGEELRITNEVPTGGRLDVSVSFYTIES